MKSRTMEVTKCEDLNNIGGCPFNYDTIECRAKTKVATDGFGVEVHSPDFENCPLREEQIIVKLKSGI